MRRTSLLTLALAACGGTSPSSNSAADHRSRSCPRTDDDMLLLFVKSAGAQLAPIANDLYTEKPDDNDPDSDEAPPDRDHSWVDPRQHLAIMPAFDDVQVATARFGSDGSRAAGVAGILLGCRYIPVAAAPVTPIDGLPLLPDALVELGWREASHTRKQQLARDFVVDVLLATASPMTDPSPDFDVTFRGDDGKPAHTPRFAPPAAVVAHDGSAVVEVWATTPGPSPRGASYNRYRYAISASGVAKASVGERFAGRPVE